MDAMPQSTNVKAKSFTTEMALYDTICSTFETSLRHISQSRPKFEQPLILILLMVINDISFRRTLDVDS